MPSFRTACCLLTLQLGAAVTLRGLNFTAKANNATVSFAKQAPTETFRSFYDAHNTGRGVWKWQNALDAYQRHFGALAGSPVSVAEVGVQSGGSLLMWQAALGNQIHLYGLDINPATQTFQGPQVSVTIGDQADPVMWQDFFANTVSAIDILVDDGGHEAHQMMETLKSPFNHIQPGGFIAIEDIHGAHYLESFFKPAAQFLGMQTGKVESVHLYPFLMIVHMVGQRPVVPASTLQFDGPKTVVADFDQMWAAVKKNPQGGQVVLQNAGWGPFLTADGITNFFATFNGLHDSNFVDTPAGCNTRTDAICTNNISPLSETQQRVTGIHIYNDRLVVEVPPAPPVIQAVRKGTEWIGYGF